MSAKVVPNVLPMFTESDIERLREKKPYFKAQCEALLAGIRVSKNGYIVADKVDEETLAHPVSYLLDKGILGYFKHVDDGLCIGIRNQLGDVGPYIKGFCPLPNHVGPIETNEIPYNNAA